MDEVTQQLLHNWRTNTVGSEVVELVFPKRGLDSTPIMPRKLRLYYIACARQIQRHLLPCSAPLIEFAERLTDLQNVPIQEWRQFQELSAKLVNCEGDPATIYEYESELRNLGYDLPTRIYQPFKVNHFWRARHWVLIQMLDERIPGPTSLAEHVHRPIIFRDIFDCHVSQQIYRDSAYAFTASDLPKTVGIRNLAQTIYDEQSFQEMPVLADMLEDELCQNSAILRHCRDPRQGHVRGCWVLDLLLARE